MSENSPDFRKWYKEKDKEKFANFLDDQVGEENLDDRKDAIYFLASLRDPSCLPKLLQTMHFTPALHKNVEQELREWNNASIIKAFNVWGEELAKPLISFVLDPTQDNAVREQTVEMISNLDQNTTYLIYLELLFNESWVETIYKCLEKIGMLEKFIYLYGENDTKLLVAGLNLMKCSPITEGSYSSAWNAIEHKEAKVRIRAFEVFVNYVKEENPKRLVGITKEEVNSYTGYLINWGLEDEEFIVRGLAAQLAEELPDNRSLDRLISLVGDKEPFVRLRVLSALSKLPHSGTGPMLYEIYRNPEENEEIRKAALLALGSCIDDDWSDIIKFIHLN